MTLENQPPYQLLSPDQDPHQFFNQNPSIQFLIANPEFARQFEDDFASATGLESLSSPLTADTLEPLLGWAEDTCEAELRHSPQTLNRYGSDPHQLFLELGRLNFVRGVLIGQLDRAKKYFNTPDAQDGQIYAQWHQEQLATINEALQNVQERYKKETSNIFENDSGQRLKLRFAQTLMLAGVSFTTVFGALGFDLSPAQAKKDADSDTDQDKTHLVIPSITPDTSPYSFVILGDDDHRENIGTGPDPEDPRQSGPEATPTVNPGAGINFRVLPTTEAPTEVIRGPGESVEILATAPGTDGYTWLAVRNPSTVNPVEVAWVRGDVAGEADGRLDTVPNISQIENLFSPTSQPLLSEADLDLSIWLIDDLLGRGFPPETVEHLSLAANGSDAMVFIQTEDVIDPGIDGLAETGDDVTNFNGSAFILHKTTRARRFIHPYNINPEFADFGFAPIDKSSPTHLAITDAEGQVYGFFDASTSDPDFLPRTITFSDPLPAGVEFSVDWQAGTVTIGDQELQITLDQEGKSTVDTSAVDLEATVVRPLTDTELVAHTEAISQLPTHDWTINPDRTVSELPLDHNPDSFRINEHGELEAYSEDGSKKLVWQENPGRPEGPGWYVVEIDYGQEGPAGLVRILRNTNTTEHLDGWNALDQNYLVAVLLNQYGNPHNIETATLESGDIIKVKQRGTEKSILTDEVFNGNIENAVIQGFAMLKHHTTNLTKEQLTALRDELLNTQNPIQITLSSGEVLDLRAGYDFKIEHKTYLVQDQPPHYLLQDGKLITYYLMFQYNNEFINIGAIIGLHELLMDEGVQNLEGSSEKQIVKNLFREIYPLYDGNMVTTSLVVQTLPRTAEQCFGCVVESNNHPK